MPSNKDLKLRELILEEWRAKTSVEDAAKDIRQKLGEDHIVTENKVQYWFKRFDKGNTSLFGAVYSNTVLIQGDSNGSFSKHSVDSISVIIQDKDLKHSVYTNDGRLAVLPYEVDKSVSAIAFYDLFHGTNKVIKMPDNSPSFTSYRQLSIVGNYLLAEYFQKCYLFKIDYDTWQIDVLHSLYFAISVKQIIFDQLNNHNFLVYNWNKIQTGQVNDDRIQLNHWKSIVMTVSGGMSDLNCVNLAGKKLRGFKNDQYGSSLKLYELDVDTLEQTTLYTPVTIGNQIHQMQHMSHYSWIDNRCYALFNVNGLQNNKILSFSVDTYLWSDIQVLVNNVNQLFVDANEVLTLQDGKTFYRIALKKPECLKNLAWFMILRNSKLKKSKIYKKIAHRLPYTCDLRSLFDKDDEEEAEE